MDLTKAPYPVESTDDFSHDTMSIWKTQVKIKKKEQPTLHPIELHSKCTHRGRERNPGVIHKSTAAKPRCVLDVLSYDYGSMRANNGGRVGLTLILTFQSLRLSSISPLSSRPLVVCKRVCEATNNVAYIDCSLCFQKLFIFHILKRRNCSSSHFVLLCLNFVRSVRLWTVRNVDSLDRLFCRRLLFEGNYRAPVRSFWVSTWQPQTEIQGSVLCVLLLQRLQTLMRKKLHDQWHTVLSYMLRYVLMGLRRGKNFTPWFLLNVV